ncbi:hypothetical protein MGYG_02820 [Nannizzia gypsea CBS 118893]|uniref:Uncharacterized protein n=1 Tax=Arthroderma gypseum (strain ATCC MYA-4604 / CBS 118893) TaxID=535722 RepID=E4UP82_ARTGP|nr:hypothetical protein MGYG_02820 [Nannizzia gypsea CBS 118893]EFQ99808.1 hypothetical protein MGYG_02820 [Nannizzia gypsea CBS 118893]
MFCLRSGNRFSFRLGSWIHRDITTKLQLRHKVTDTLSSSSASLKRSPAGTQNGPLRAPLRYPQAKTQPTQGRAARLKPKQIVIYHAGTGKIAFIGLMRVTTILVFVVSCAVVAPAFYAAEFPWYIAPAIIIGGAIPMLFVSFTAAPFVNQVYLSLPAFTQQSREHLRAYLNKIPRNATLNVETMKFNFYPKRTLVSVSDLVPRTSMVRPVSFMNINPQPRPWWKGKDQVFFFAPEKSRPAKSTARFLPEIWEQVFTLIKSNRAP